MPHVTNVLNRVQTRRQDHKGRDGVSDREPKQGDLQLAYFTISPGCVGGCDLVDVVERGVHGIPAGPRGDVGHGMAKGEGKPDGRPDAHERAENKQTDEARSGEESSCAGMSGGSGYAVVDEVVCGYA